MQWSDRLQRRTKIICTIGPKTSSYEALKKLYEAGMDIVRLNMSHSSIEECADVMGKVNSLNEQSITPIGILLDTKGPEIRTGDINESYMLEVGSVVDVTVGGGANVEQKSSIVIDYSDLKDSLDAGDRITVDNGLINLDVIQKTDFGFKCTVVDGGLMRSRRHINLPGIRINLPAITPHDERDILFGIQHDVNFIALSFVRSAQDVLDCNRLFKDQNKNIGIIAKIEDFFGVQNYEEIIQASYGVMVARGDLGVEVPIEELPIIQRKIIKKTSELGKKCIIATHLLESMIENPLPTRAEVTDVANAVFEEADGIMLSGETAVGQYPVKAVEYLHKIAKRTEQSGGIGWAIERTSHTSNEKLSKVAVDLAFYEQAKAIFVFTHDGVMADIILSFHPHVSPVFAFTDQDTTYKKLILGRNCYPQFITLSNKPESDIQHAIKIIRQKNLLPLGSTVVILSNITTVASMSKAVQIRRI